MKPKSPEAIESHITLFNAGVPVGGGNPALGSHTGSMGFIPAHGNMTSRAFRLDDKISSTGDNPTIKKNGLGVLTPALPGQAFSEVTFPTSKQESGMPGIRRIVETSQIEDFFDTDEFARKAIAKAAFEHATGLPEPTAAAAKEFEENEKQKTESRNKSSKSKGKSISNKELDKIFSDLQQEFPE